MKELQKQVRSLNAQLRDVQAYLGVLRPVFEREYKRGGWNWEGKPVRKTRKR